jgi:hypothetical protein
MAEAIVPRGFKYFIEAPRPSVKFHQSVADTADAVSAKGGEIRVANPNTEKIIGTKAVTLDLTKSAISRKYKQTVGCIIE